VGNRRFYRYQTTAWKVPDSRQTRPDGFFNTPLAVGLLKEDIYRAHAFPLSDYTSSTGPVQLDPRRVVLGRPVPRPSQCWLLDYVFSLS
jgi:hypothetical protein